MSDTAIAKPWYKSVTLLFNIAAGAAILIEWMILEGFPIVDNPYFVMVVTAVNFILRFKTEKPVAASAKVVDIR